MSNIIDCKGLKCPQPVINTKKYFDSVDQGEATVIVDNEISKNNIIKFAQGSGYKQEASEIDGAYHIKINKESCSCEAMSFEEKKFTIVISTNKLGEGDDSLGLLLMKSYLYALSESDKLPTDLIFMNAGVKLTSEGSDSLESLKRLQEKGVNIINCGTCLDFFSLKEKLVVGEISNMYTIVEKMNSAENTIKL